MGKTSTVYRVHLLLEGVEECVLNHLPALLQGVEECVLNHLPALLLTEVFNIWKKNKITIF